MICKECGREVPKHWSGLCGICAGFDSSQTKITRGGLDKVRGTGLITKRERSDGLEYAGVVVSAPTEEQVRRGREFLENGTPDDEGPSLK